MQKIFSDLGKFNNPGVLRIIWETFAELARQPQAMDSSNTFYLEGQDGVFNSAFARCKEAGLIPDDVRRYGSPFKHIVLKVYHSALSMGLLLPSRLDQALDWDAGNGPFHFTADGVNYFQDGFVSIDDPGHLGQILQDLKARLPVIHDGQVELLLEAQRCVRSGCYRAGIVVMGVASEDACTALLEVIPANCQAPAPNTSFHGDWTNCTSPTANFTQRWKPAVRILEEIKKRIRAPGRGQSWWPWWEMVPGSLYTLGEAVRISRNAAAHDTTRKFTKAEVALLLSAMPTHLEMIANLINFLQNPPLGLAPLQI